MDWGEMAGREVKPFEGVNHMPRVDIWYRTTLTCIETREWVRKQISSIWTASSPAPQTPAQENDRPLKPPR